MFLLLHDASLVYFSLSSSQESLWGRDRGNVLSPREWPITPGRVVGLVVKEIKSARDGRCRAGRRDVALYMTRQQPPDCCGA